MTLFGQIIKKVKSNDSLYGRQRSPPPEIDVDNIVIPKRRRPKNYHPNVKAKVDTSPPMYPVSLLKSHLYSNVGKFYNLADANMRLARHLVETKAKVDSRWHRAPEPLMQHYKSRVDFRKNIERRNKALHLLYTSASPKIVTTKSLNSDWTRTRRRIVELARMKFILFAPIPQEDIEDPSFRPLAGAQRIRLYLTLRIVGKAELGLLLIELFTEICPATVKLFLELLTAKPKNFSYINSPFFKKVPEMFWTGGDVVYGNGFGCYAQKGRVVPIGAENFHYPHSMPGLLSMRVTRNDEVCGIFNITFKPIPQFDLKNVVFGRVVRPSETYEAIKSMGNPFGSHPVVIIDSYTVCRKSVKRMTEFLQKKPESLTKTHTGFSFENTF